MRPSHFFALGLAVSQVSLAWMDPFGEDSAVLPFDGLLNRRQNDNANQDSSSQAPPETTSPPDPNSTPTDGANQDQNSNTDEASQSGTRSTGRVTGTNKDEGSKTTAKPTQTKFGDLTPAGGIKMIQPDIFEGQQFYKIGDWVTFAWNYTSVRVMPTAVDILATCTKNQATYTLAVNQTADETGKLYWDTGAYQKTGVPQLLTEIYTLIIYDSNSSSTAAPVPGYLAPYKQFTFGMYTPQSYTPLNDGFKCPTCNGAGSLSPTEIHGLALAGIMGIITVLSFTWFASGFGIF